MLQLHPTERQYGYTLTSALKAVSIIDPLDLLVPIPRRTIPNISTITFLPGRAAYYLDMSFFTGTYRERSQYTSGGTIYSSEISFQQRGINLNTDFLRAKIQNRKLHVLCTLQDGSQKLAKFIRFSSIEDTGDSSTQNRYEFQGLGSSLNTSPWIAGNVNIITPIYTAPEPTEPGTGTGFVPIEITTVLSQHTYTVPAGKLLMAIFIRSDSAQTISIGYSAGSSDLAGPFEMGAGQKIKFGDNWIIPVVDTNIYITGLSGTNEIQICVL